MQNDREELFIKKFAQFLAGDQMQKGIKAQMGDKLAVEWAEVRAAIGIFGYPTVAEAEKFVRKMLWDKAGRRLDEKNH